MVYKRDTVYTGLLDLYQTGMVSGDNPYLIPSTNSIDIITPGFFDILILVTTNFCRHLSILVIYPKIFGEIIIQTLPADVPQWYSEPRIELRLLTRNPSECILYASRIYSV